MFRLPSAGLLFRPLVGKQLARICRTDFHSEQFSRVRQNGIPVICQVRRRGQDDLVRCHADVLQLFPSVMIRSASVTETPKKITVSAPVFSL